MIGDMVHNHLPNEMRGNWIWVDRRRGDVESRLLLRRVFTLDAIPSSADLWLAARTFSHIYVNGFHLNYALAACPEPDSYVWYHDIAYLLGTGVNSIAILAHNAKVARTSCHLQESGLWCQVNIDGAPAIWTGRSWRVREAEAFAANRPRRSLSDGFTEKQDLRLLPAGWTERGFQADDWLAPDHIVPISQGTVGLRAFPGPEMSVSPVPFEKLSVRGGFVRENFAANVTFEKLVSQRGAGTYAAEAYFHTSDLTELSFELYCDSPYRLFVNGKCLKEQGVRPVVAGASLRACRALGFGQDELAEPEGKMLLEEGWNRIVFCQELQPGAAGMTLVVPDHHIQALRMLRHPDAESLPGWTIAGPLRTPLANLLGNFNLSLADNLEFYIPVEERPVDEGAELMSCSFTASSTKAQLLSEDKPLTLKQGEYLILELPHCLFGCPRFLVEGTPGDVLDLISAAEIVDGQLLPWDSGRNQTDTVILAGGLREWMSCAPRGVRYLQVVARKVADIVTITQPQVKVRHYDFGNPGGFESSDKALNEIWEIGRRTLETTVQEVFLDSPSKDETQYIADAAIEAWAAYHVCGDFDLSAKGLEEFAHAQFETGEMPAACPSDIYCNIPDYALLWPVWLQRHYQYTGDRQLLSQMLPNLEKLFSYFAQVSVAGRDVLGDLADRHGGYCFLDHGDIDRQGIVTGLNALYCRSLLSGAALFEAAGNPERARPLREVCARVAQQVRELTWDAERGLFADSWHDGGRSRRFSLPANVLAIYGGVARSEDYSRIFAAFFETDAPYRKHSAGDAPNPYFMYFILETAFALGRREWGLNFMRWYWQAMARRGARTWWELFDPTDADRQQFVGSQCHGYGCSPNGFLISEVAGIRPAKPGFTTIFFNPLTAGIKWVKAKVPTTYGQIAIEWEMKKGGQLDAVIEANYPLSVIPEMEPGMAAGATLHVSDNVTIFASE